MITAAFLLFLAFCALLPNAQTEWRASGTYTLEPDLGFFHKPNSKSFARDSYGNTESVTINNLGLRGHQISLKKEKNRVILLGDSMVFGHGVRDDETMSFHLETLMAQGHSQAEVINAGVKGYGIDQEYKLLQRLLKLDPDYVVWFLYSNDFIHFNNVELTLYDYDHDSDLLVERDISQGMFYKSTMLYLWISRWIKLDSISFVYRVFNNISSSQDAKKSRETKTLARKFGKFSRMLATTSRSKGFKVIYMVLPDQVHEKSLAYLKEFSAIPIIDLNDDSAFLASWNKLFLKHDPHLSSFGHELVAERVKRWIETNP